MRLRWKVLVVIAIEEKEAENIYESLVSLHKVIHLKYFSGFQILNLYFHGKCNITIRGLTMVV